MLDFSLQYPTSRTKQHKYETLDYQIPETKIYVSRYSETRNIKEKDTAYIIQETYNKSQIVTTDNDRFFKVTHKTENRLDIISYNVYGYSLYWWVIAMANDIVDPFNVPVNTILRIPPISSLYETYSVLGTKENKLAKMV